MIKNYQLGVKYELGLDVEVDYKKAYHYYKLAKQEGSRDAVSKTKYYNISMMQIIILVISLFVGIFIDVNATYAYQGMFLISVINILSSLYFKSKYWVKNGFANIFSYSVFYFMTIILLPISILKPYLEGITWVPVVAIFVIAFFILFSMIVIFLLDRNKKYFKYILLGFYLLMLTGASFGIETQDKMFLFEKIDDQIIITGYRYSENELVIPNELNGKPVVAIADFAFYKYQFKTVKLGENLTYIGSYAFAGNYALKEIEIFDGIQLGSSVFSDNYNLETVILPNDIEVIREGTFYNNLALKEIIIPESVYHIGTNSFKNTGLSNISLPNSLLHLGGGAFAGTKISHLNIPESVEQLGSLNDMNYLESFNFPNNITQLPSNFLRNNKNIKNLVIPETVEKIGDYAFSGSNIENIIMHENITSIGEGLFYQAQELETVILPSSITVIPKYTFAFSGIKAFNMKNTVTQIENFAFHGATLLEELTLSNSLTSMGQDSFSNTISLEEVILPNSLKHVGTNAFKGAINLKTLVLPNELLTIRSSAFENTPSLSNVDLPESLLNIEQNAFKGSGLTSIVLPTSLNSIGNSSFENNDNLILIRINSQINYVGQNAFKINNQNSIIYFEDVIDTTNWSNNWNPNGIQIIIN